MKNLIEKIKKNWLIKRTTTLLFVAILIGLFIGITIWINSLNWDSIDFTPEKIYTLTDTSKDIIKNINSDVNIYFVEYFDRSAVLDFARQYHNVNEKINVETITASERPDLAQKYGIETGYSGVIVESNGKFKVLSDSDFYTYDMVTYEEIDITEEKLTNAILYVTSEKIPKIYFLEGYSDYSISKNMYLLTVYLGNEITEYDTVNVLSAGSIPEDCDTLVIMTPNSDFDEFTTNAIMDYIARGGNILWFNSLLTEKQEYANVNRVLAMYGVAPFEVGCVSESEATRRISSSTTIIIPDVEYNEITRNLTTVVLFNPTRINFVSDEELQNLNVTKEVLFKSSENSQFITNFATSAYEEGSYVIAAKLEKQISAGNTELGIKAVSSKLIIFGENNFISDAQLPGTNSQTALVQYFKNRNAALDSIAYLVDRQDDIIIRKDTNATTFTSTEQQNKIIETVIFGLPIIIIFTGIIVWQHRRRKK